MKLDPSKALLSAQSAGVAFLVILVVCAAQLDFRDPLALLPIGLLYLFTQAAFRLGLRQARRRPRARNFLFIA